MPRFVALLVLFAAFLFQSAVRADLVAGDLAPYGSPDGVLTSADLLVLQRFVSGELIPTPEELLVGDVAPLNNPDGQLNAGDLVVLQRAVLGLVTLPPIDTGSDAPTLNAGASPTNDNPYTVTGTASPDTVVRLYVNGLYQSSVNAAPDGGFSVNAILHDGLNEITVTAWNGSTESAASNALNVDYINNIPRSQSGMINVDTVWTPAGPGGPNDPYLITGNLTVSAGANLILPAGTVLQFGSGYYLQIDGTLTVSGTASEPVVFTSNNATPAAGNWSGIRITSGATDVVIDNARIEYASNGITFTGAGGTLSNSLIENNYTGVSITDASPTLQGNIVRSNSNYGVFVYRYSNPMIDGGNTIAGNNYGVYVYGGSTASDQNPHPVVSGNSIYANQYYNYYAANFYDNENVHLATSGNWWGSVDPATIHPKLYDYTDNPNSGPVVDYSGFLDAPGGAAVAGTYLNGPFGADTTLIAGTVYTALGDLHVPAGVTLTIPAGVEMRFPPSLELGVAGTLLVAGTSSEPVLFTSAKATPAASDWAGIKITSGATGVVIDHAQIEYASNGVSFTGAGGTVSSSTIENNFNGISITDASPTVQGNSIRNNGNYGLYIYRYSSPIIDNGNMITGNNYGLYVYGGSTANDQNPHPVVTGNSIHGNLYYHYYASNFYNNDNVRLAATGNWWGSADPAVIEPKIYDYTEFPNGAPVLDYSGFLDGPGGAAVPGAYLNGAFGTDTTLTAGTLYTVLGDLHVSTGVTLSIPAGVVIRFPANRELGVSGTLIVAGSASEPVVFTSAKPTPAAGDWAGIKINASATGVAIDRARIEYATNGVSFTGTGGTLTNSTIENNNTGISITDASPTVQGNTIRNNSNYGLYIYRYSNPLINGGNTITANGYGLYVQGGSTASNQNPAPVVSGNGIYGNASSNYYAYNFHNNSNVHLAATGNWWGGVDPAVIGAKIYDYTDAPSLSPVVDYSGFLNGPGGTAVPGTYLNGSFGTDTTLNAGTVYTVLGDLHVPAGVTLTIPAGATLRFPINLELSVAGTLLVAGTAAEPVVFTSNKATPAAGDWAGIKITSGATGVVIDHAQIEYASNGITFTGAGGMLSNSVIENNHSGVSITDGSPTVQGNSIRNNRDYGLYIYRYSNPVINGGNTITGNGYGLYVRGASTSSDQNPHPVVSGNSIYANTTHNYYAYFFYDNANVRLDATGNWWGSTDPAVIEPKIYDYSDNPSAAPVVDYSGFLEDSGGAPVTGSYLNGSFGTDTTLSGGMVYTVLGDLHVPSGVTLTIPAGAELRFPGNWTFHVAGNLVVTGTASDPVVFTSDRTTPAAGDWPGIRVESTGSADLDHAIVEYAQYGIDVRGVLSLSNSLVHFNVYGLQLYQNGASAAILDSQLVYNTQFALYAYGTGSDATNPQFTLNNSDLFGNASGALYVYNYGASSLSLDATGNWWGTPTPQINVDIKGNSASIVNYANPAPSPLKAPALSSISVDYLYISPANGDAVQDAVVLSGPLSESADWTVEVRDSLGNVVQTAAGTGTSISASWDGRDTLGQLQAEGRYSLVVNTSAGTRAGQAGRGYVIVDDTAPLADLDDALNGTIIQNLLVQDLTGTASDENFAQYQVEYGAGVTPAAWSPVSGIFNAPILNDLLDSWIVGTIDGTPPLDNGLYTLRLTVTDKAGNTTTDTVQMTLDNLATYNVTENLAAFSPTLNESVQIEFTVNLPADVTLNVYSAQDDALIYTTPQSVLAGTNAFTWDGTGTGGLPITDGTYYYTLTAADGTRIGNYMPPLVATPSDLFMGGGASVPFNTFKNEFFKQAATAPVNGRARLRIALATSPYIGQVIYPDGDGIDMLAGETRTFLWDGRIPGTADIFIGTMTAYLDFTPHGPNYVTVRTPAPVITGPNAIGPAAPYLEVKADPYIVYLSYGQLVKVHYHIDRDAQVTIKLLPPGVTDFDDASAVLVKNESQAAQDHTVEWQGLVPAGDGRDRSLPADGVYTLAIEAVAGDTGASTLYRAVLSAYQ
ncbi:MAG: right-handed parallel beta-helix repeat-containing protein [Thiogranum sp.]|nr:right-handed parallel beta-helix repeat-containing protein [Thiogranum sp.]